MIERQEQRDRLDDKFKLTLRRLSGDTSGVTIDDIIEFLVFVQKYGVNDLSFVEEAYKASIFSDDEFLVSSGIIVCSVEQFIEVWEVAKQKKDVIVLKLFRDAHRKARSFLLSPEIKQRIANSIIQIDQKVLHRDYYDLLSLSVRFAREHIKNVATEYLIGQFIPSLSALASKI